MAHVAHNHGSENNAELPTLLAALDDAAGQAVIVYGPRASGKSTLLQAAAQALLQTGNCIPVVLNLRNSLERSRAEVIHELATNAVDATGLAPDLLDDFVPNHFHQSFLEKLLQALPPPKTLLFVFDDIDIQDRTQVSKLNNLILPLLRRLAPLARLKFILAVDDADAAKILLLVRPIFAAIHEIELTAPLPQVNVQPAQTRDVQHPRAQSNGESTQIEAHPRPLTKLAVRQLPQQTLRAEAQEAAQEADKESPVAKTTVPAPKPLRLVLLIVVILILLLNIWILFPMLNQVP